MAWPESMYCSQGMFGSCSLPKDVLNKDLHKAQLFKSLKKLRSWLDHSQKYLRKIADTETYSSQISLIIAYTMRKDSKLVTKREITKVRMRKTASQSRNLDFYGASIQSIPGYWLNVGGNKHQNWEAFIRVKQASCLFPDPGQMLVAISIKTEKPLLKWCLASSNSDSERGLRQV